jgi:carbamoyl-phosphate synthase large subunit
MIGASIPVIQKAEDREKFRNAMSHIGLRVPKSGIARTMEEARLAAETIGYPLIIRASFTLGGSAAGLLTIAKSSKCWQAPDWMPA